MTKDEAPRIAARIFMGWLATWVVTSDFEHTKNAH